MSILKDDQESYNMVLDLKSFLGACDQAAITKPSSSLFFKLTITSLKD